MGLLAFILFVGTGARTIQWQDSAQFTYRITTGNWDNEYGLAMVHPVHFLLGRLAAGAFPSQIPWALSGLSALGGALAVAGVTATVHHQTRSISAALYGGGVLMLAHTFWRFSGLPEVYTLSAALLILEVAWFLRMSPEASGRRWGVLFLINGLALGNHNLALLSLPVWGGCWLLRCRKGTARFPDVGWIAGGWFIGAAPFLGLILIELLHGESWGTVLHSALFGYGFREEVTGLLPDVRILGTTLGFLLLSFPLIPWWLAFRAVRSDVPTWGPVAVLAGVHGVFFLRYNVIDQYTFFIPVMALLALFAGVGFSGISLAWVRRCCFVALLLQPLGYAVMPSLVRSSGVMASLERRKPYRDDYHYLFWPWMVSETSADQLSEDAVAAAGPGTGVVAVEDPMAFHAVAWKMTSRGQRVRVVYGRDLSQDGIGVWIPARSDAPLQPGWTKQGEVWIRDHSILDTPTGEE